MLALYLFAAIFFVQDQQKPLPELKPFLEELRKTLHTDGLLLSQYTYTDKLTEIELDSKGKAKKTEVSAFRSFQDPPDTSVTDGRSSGTANHSLQKKAKKRKRHYKNASSMLNEDEARFRLPN